MVLDPVVCLMTWKVFCMVWYRRIRTCLLPTQFTDHLNLSEILLFFLIRLVQSIDVPSVVCNKLSISFVCFMAIVEKANQLRLFYLDITSRHLDRSLKIQLTIPQYQRNSIGFEFLWKNLRVRFYSVITPRVVTMVDLGHGLKFDNLKSATDKDSIVDRVLEIPTNY
jgi:hypothetical protein